MATAGIVPVPKFETVDCLAGDAIGDLVYCSGMPVGGDLQVAKADATDPDKRPPIGVIASKVSSTECTIQYGGLTEELYAGLTPGKTYWLGSAGLPVEDPPGGHPCQYIGVAVSDKVIALNFVQIEEDTGGGGGGGGVESETLTYTDTTNKVLGPLNDSPASFMATALWPVTGVIQDYTQDYTVREVIGGSAPGYYICISPTSTAPGGGAFSGGTNPGTGIESVLTSGDKTRVIYPI
jgi:hypothetical protein